MSALAAVDALIDAGFQMHAPLDAETLAALRESVQERGIKTPLVVDQYRRILDGHHRHMVAVEQEFDDVPVHIVHVIDDDDARDLARMLNTLRRHDAPEVRRVNIFKLRESGLSVRAIAAQTGMSVGTVHGDLATVQPEQLPERITGLDGKSRPATMPPRPAPPAPPAPLEPTGWFVNGPEDDEDDPYVDDVPAADWHAAVDLADALDAEDIVNEDEDDPEEDEDDGQEDDEEDASPPPYTEPWDGPALFDRRRTNREFAARFATLRDTVRGSGTQSLIENFVPSDISGRLKDCPTPTGLRELARDLQALALRWERHNQEKTGAAS